MSVLAWLLVALPLGTGVVLAGAGRRADRVAPALAGTVALLTLLLGCVAAVVRPAASAPLFDGIRAGLAVDGLSAVLVLTVAAVTFAVLVFSTGDLAPDEPRARFFGLMLVFAGAMLLTVTATTLPLLLGGWEVMGATSYALIAFWWREPVRVAAATTAFLTTRLADLGLYVAAGAALAGGVDTLALAGLPQARSPWLDVVTVGIVVSALGKSAQLPFSFWLSRAMEGPSPVSALLHSATMVAAGGYLLLRLHPLLTASGWGAPTVAWVGAATALLLGLVAVAQTDLKQLLAASTCAQVGFIVLAAGAGSVTGGTLQLVAHAATKSLLFLAAGAWLTALGTKALPALRGAARDHPLVGVTFTVGALTLAGLPPLSIWASKDVLLAAALQHGPGLYAVGLAAAAVSAVYSIKAVWFVWQPRVEHRGHSDTEQAGTGHVATASRPPLVALATAAAALGVLALPAVAGPLERALQRTGEPSPGWPELVGSAALAVAASAGTWWWGARRFPVPAAATRWLGRWLDLERVAHLLVVRPTLSLAAGLAAVDDRVIDGAVNALARGALRLARTAARLDDIGVDGAVSHLAAGTRRLGRLARVPQTGQLHTYYAQAATAFALLALVFALVR